MKVPVLEELNSNNVREKIFKNRYPEFYEYILEQYNLKELSFQEKLYLYYNSLDSRPLCVECKRKYTKFTGIKTGYRDYCCRACMNSSNITKSKRKDTCQERYGTDNVFKSDLIKEKIKDTCQERYGTDNVFKSDLIKEKIKDTCQERYGVEYYTQTEEYKEKSKSTCLEKYGVEYFSQSDEFKSLYNIDSFKKSVISNISNTCLEKYGVDSYFKTNTFKEKSSNTRLQRYGDINFNNPKKHKLTCLERYGDSNYNNIEKAYNTCLERYGVENYTKTEAFKELYKDPDFVRAVQEKSYNTKKKNGTFNSSKIEELFNDYLIANNIEFKSQYKSDLYPFSCDFYIPSKDLYIEIQASWTHGDHPFNENDKEDIKKLNLWQSKGTDYYNNAIYVWTVRDPLKREIAKKNGIKLLEVFSNNIEDLIYIFEEDHNKL